eukprot:IDg673t1
MGPNRTYLSREEVRSDVRGTDFQKYKQRITTVFCVNADGSHKLPMRYIGSAVKPACFRDHSTAPTFYSQQPSAWIDGEKFNDWIHWWYSEVKKITVGPWLLILDNCSGHELHNDLPGFRIVYLPPNYTAKYQPLDLGLISQSKIRYRSLLLRACIDVVIRLQSPDHGFKDNSGRGRWGVREGQLPHVADAISIFNQSWTGTSSNSIIKCWIKSTCLAHEHNQALYQKLHDSEEIMIDLTQSVSNRQSNMNDVPSDA